MKTIKAIIFVCIVLLTLTAGNCFIVSSFDSSSSRDDENREGLTIVVTNAETTSSEVVQSLTHTLTVAELASQSAQYVNEVYLSDPISYSCDNASGVVILRNHDLDHSNRVSAGDELVLSYTNCLVEDVTANGDLTILVQDALGVDIGRFDSGSDWLYTLSVNASSFQVSTDDEIFVANGDIEIALQFDATTAMLETNITNNTLSLEGESQIILSNIDISQFLNLAVVPSSYMLTIDSMKISSGVQGGTVDATAKPNPLSGMELLNLREYFVDLLFPDSGVINISGKNSNADVSILPDEMVSIELDTNGDSILDAVISSTWPDMQEER